MWPFDMAPSFELLGSVPLDAEEFKTWRHVEGPHARPRQ